MVGAVRGVLTACACGLIGIACSNPVVPAARPEPQSEVTPDERATGIAYFEVEGAELTMDVHVPARGDDDVVRPVVVLFHGLSSATNDAPDVTLVADAAVAAGMVVFAPEWIAGDPFPVLVDDLVMLRRAGECAVAFAQAEAARFGGDPSRTVTSGFSAGTGPALSAATAPVAGQTIPGCAAGPTTAPVIGTVLGDGEYFWQSEPFDGAFAADTDAMREETGLLIDPTTWTLDSGLRLRLWAAADRTAPRVIDMSADGPDWLTDRDPDGSIRSELRAVGALDDGSIDYLDNATLLDARAAAAGIDVELVVHPGGHTVEDKVPAIVEHLVGVVTES